ncbi:MAG: carboxypeptidase regulatory-like domain-containing protein [Acidobacteriota bacterium]
MNWVFGLLLFGATGSAAAETPAERDPVARLEGRVAGRQGEPVVGAMVSVFGVNLARGALIAITDENGRFRVSDLPPGFYNLRAYLSGFLPSRFSTVEVTEEGNEVAPVSMQLERVGSEGGLSKIGPLDEGLGSEPAAESNAEEEDQRVAELKWILRHGKRNILHRKGYSAREDFADEPTVASASLAPQVDVSGELGVLASAFEQGLDQFPGAGSGLDARLAYARLNIPTGPKTHWRVSAQLMESALSSWAARAEFITQAFPGQRLSAGVSYGNHLYGDLEAFRPPEAAFTYRRDSGRYTEWFGNVFGAHRFALGPAEIDAGMVYHHYSYLDRSDYAAPRLEVSWAPGSEKKTVLRGLVDYKVLAPGGEDMDLLARMVSADFLGRAAESEGGLRAERTVRYQIAVEHRVGGSRSVELRMFQEEVADQMVKTYLPHEPRVQIGPGRYLVSNQGDFRARGVGLAISQSFGPLAGSVGYTYGQGSALLSQGDDFDGGSEDIHDLTTTVETAIDRTNTRLLAVYRLVRHPSLLPGEGAAKGTSLDSRFNFQVYQVLPFMGWDRTKWELMVAVRNLFYEDMENATFLNELAVIDSPRRVLGGVSVRF